jgi:hypothetical protein
VATDVLTLVEEIAASGGGVEQPHRVLAQRATSLMGQTVWHLPRRY